MPHVIELWEMRGDQRTTYTPACLNCGWVGSGGTPAQAEAEGRMHEQDEDQAWQRQTGDTGDSGIRDAA